MFIKLLLIFTLVPIVEIYVILRAGELIGVGATIALIVLTGVAGAWLARTQGFDMIRRVQQEAMAGRVPAEIVLDGAMILVGGLLLLTPGFCSDLLGFTLLTPLTRQLWKDALRHWLKKQIDRGRITLIHR